MFRLSGCRSKRNGLPRSIVCRQKAARGTEHKLPGLCPKQALKPVLLAGAKSPLGTQAKMPTSDDNCILRELTTRFIVCSWKRKKRHLALAVFGESKKPFVN
jgi:hypothetical protein